MKKIFLAMVMMMPVVLLATEETVVEPVPQKYTLPGIIGRQNNGWVGSDHLFNMPANIPVEVEVVIEQGSPIQIDKESYSRQVQNIFTKAKITPAADSSSNVEQLPFFHLFIMVQPVDKFWVVYCSGRLFEAVTLSRVQLDANIRFQAITWEKQNLVVVPTNEAKEQIALAVEEIANAFTERFGYFQALKTGSTSP